MFKVLSTALISMPTAGHLPRNGLELHPSSRHATLAPPRYLLQQTFNVPLLIEKALASKPAKPSKPRWPVGCVAQQISHSALCAPRGGRTMHPASTLQDLQRGLQLCHHCRRQLGTKKSHHSWHTLGQDRDRRGGGGGGRLGLGLGGCCPVSTHDNCNFCGRNTVGNTGLIEGTRLRCPNIESLFKDVTFARG